MLIFLAEDPLYVCHVTEDCVQPWYLNGKIFASDQFQDCYMPGLRDLVRNNYVRYLVKFSAQYTIQVCEHLKKNIYLLLCNLFPFLDRFLVL